MRVPSSLSFGAFALLLASLPVGAETPVASTQPTPTPQAVEFFEKKVRPVLVEHCYSCHGEKKQQAGLRLDSRAALLKGSSERVVVIPGDPEKSLLIQAIRQTGKLKMPEGGKLPEKAVEALTAWVKMGVPWPESGAGPDRPLTIAEVRRTHWSYQPVQRPLIPEPMKKDWPNNPVDSYVLARIENEGMQPNPSADRRTLLRRLSFDLIGLPPTPEQVADFEADRSPDAWAKGVDRLLASPQYGERWGRHWLDVARYADTKGYVFLEERRYPFSYTYRDYVIRAFNEDLPYDRFILEQLAADLLPSNGDPRTPAAMGFLTLGRRFLNNTHDIIDDRLDVTFRGLQGLTVACARCHDHKFDPIPTKDYYSLYGVFASSVEPKELPLIATAERTPAVVAFEKELQKREAEFNDFVKGKHVELLSKFRTHVGDYLLALRDTQRLPGEEANAPQGPTELPPLIVGRWKEYLAERKNRHDPIFSAWIELAALPQKEFATRAATVVKRLTSEDDPKKRLHPLLLKAFQDAKPPTQLADVSAHYNRLFADVENLWQEELKQATEGKKKSPEKLSDPDRESLRQVIYGKNSPTRLEVSEIGRPLLDRKDRNTFSTLSKKIEEWKANTPAAPPRAMVLNDAPAPHEPRVFLRGNPGNQGEIVPRQFLQILAGEQRKPFRRGSGRLEMAQAIVSRDNPLTARVLVNRLWQHHFGEGIVRTPSDFGSRGEKPSHPELLEYLASELMDNGWSIKHIHRLILLSQTYQQQSAIRADYQERDPDNVLLWRMNRRRLELEPLRDSFLAVADRLNLHSGGPAVELTSTPFTTRRTIYGFVDRQNVPGMFRNFDVASPDYSNAQRHDTTVPQQALFLMNGLFAVEQTRRLAERTDLQILAEPEQRIERLYQLLYQRRPDADEMNLGLHFLQRKPTGTNDLSPWEKYVQVLLMANEFAYVD